MQNDRDMRGAMRAASTRLKARLANDRGGVAVAFALSVTSLVPVTMVGLDLYVASNQQSKLQDALDAATLFAARSSAKTDAEIASIGAKALQSNLQLTGEAKLLSSDFRLDGPKVISTARVEPASYSGKILGPGYVGADSEVMRSVDRLEIALVLDNTGSMQGTKLTTLKSAAKNLVDKLEAQGKKSTEPNPVKIALVPFSNTVRVAKDVSLTSYNPANPALTVPAWIDPLGKAHRPIAQANFTTDIFSSATYTDRLSLMKTLNQVWAGCVEARRAPYDVQETAPDPTVPATMFIPYFWPDERDGTAYNNYLTDDGGATNALKQSAVAKYTTKKSTLKTTTFALDSSAYGGPYKYGPNAGCVLQPIIRLTTTMTSVKTAIDGMTAVGETNIPTGLAWGWHALSPNAPLADGSAYGTANLKKIVVLMTDGDNTMNDPSSTEDNKSFYGGYGYLWQLVLDGVNASSTTSQRTTAIDARLTLLCKNMRDKNILIYTVRVEVKSGSNAVLKGCATRSDMFYDVQDVSDLDDAFDSIAGSIADLRLSK